MCPPSSDTGSDEEQESDKEGEEEASEEEQSEEEGEEVGYYLRKRRPVIYQYQPVLQVSVLKCAHCVYCIGQYTLCV